MLRRSDKSVAPSGSGPAPYLDINQMVAVARAESCDAVHPGYGFLSESGQFGRACADSGLYSSGHPRNGIDTESLAGFGPPAMMANDNDLIAQALGADVRAVVRPGTSLPTSSAKPPSGTSTRWLSHDIQPQESETSDINDISLNTLLDKRHVT
jgi:hypothetical protein